MLDGRKHTHARIAAAVTATALTTIGLGAVAPAPAAAAPNDINAVQAQVERLSERAQAADERHGAAHATLTKTQNRLDRVRADIRHHRQVLDTMRVQVASAVSSTEVSAAGASTPAQDLSKRSAVLLSNVTLATEEAGVPAEALADSNIKLAQLHQRRVKVRDQVDAQAARESTLRQQQRAQAARVANASAHLQRLEAKAEAARVKAAAERQERLGGPAVAYAKSKIGSSYVYGASGPSSFDCSGLTSMAWKQAGVSLPRTSSAQYNSGPRVSESELKPGDLVFYYSPVSHVGIYIGDGQIVNALNPGSGVKISGLHDMPYVGAVRPG